MRPTTSAGRTELLASVPLFRGCSARELTEIDLLIEDIDVGGGEVITREGESARQSYIVVAGEASVSVHGVEVARLGPGGFFGEMAVLDSTRPPQATVTALTSMRLLLLQPTAFEALMRLAAVSRCLGQPVPVDHSHTPPDSSL
jgi:CRP-like cAMP-binding protein